MQVGIATGLTDQEIAVIDACFRAILEGPWLSRRDELQVRMGISRDILEQIARAWPGYHDLREEGFAVSGALREVAYGIRFTENEWGRWFTVEKAQLKELATKVHRFRKGEASTGPQ